MISAAELIQTLRGGGLMLRTGILLLPPKWVGQEQELAGQLMTNHLDYARWKQPQLRGRFVQLDHNSVCADLDEISHTPNNTNVWLISNLDLALSYLSFSQRSLCWSFLQNNLRNRPRALVIALPQNATLLLPAQQERNQWIEANRLALMYQEESP